MIKLSISLFLILNFYFNSALALPRFAVQNGSSCILCHVNPTGGGLRNDHGTNVVALDELPLERWLERGNEDWEGYVGDHLQVGGDFRLQGIQYNNSDTTRETAFFPMQADIYTYLNLHENAGVFTKIGIRGSGFISPEYWFLLNNLPQNAWLRIGRTLPNYGLRVDDHTSFIRAGNLSKTNVGLEKEGFFFTPSKSMPVILEWGMPLKVGLRWTTSASTPIVFNGEGLKNFTSQIYYSGSFDQFSLMLSLNYMQEEDFTMVGISGGLAYADFTWTFEADRAENWIEGSQSLALYDEIAWEIIQGIQLIGKYDFFDPETEWASGAISRYTFGAEIYPLNIMEIKLQVRLSKIGDENFKHPEYLIQSHFWF